MADEPITLPTRAGGALPDIYDPMLSALIKRLAYPCDSDCQIDSGQRVIVPPSSPTLAFQKTREKKKKALQPQETGGNSAINAALPRSGPGFKAYKGIETEYGYPPTVEFVKTLGQGWQQKYPKGPLLQIGDLAVQGGGPTPRSWGHPELGFHISHGSGRDFDVQIIATGDKEQKPRSITIKDSTYDRQRTQQLVDLIISAGNVALILSADKELHGTKESPVIFDKSHTHHLHVRLKP